MSSTNGGEVVPTGQLELKARDGEDIEATTAPVVPAKDEPAKSDDPVQDLMGAIGKWQLFTCFVIFMLKFPVAWHQMGIIFLAPPVDFSCIPPQDETPNIILDRCDSQCIGHEFNRSIFTETITTEFDLVCEKAQLPNLSQTIFMLGILTGNVVFGSMADTYGRRNPLVIAVVVQLVFGVATSFATSFWLFCILRFVTAMATGGTMVTSFVITMEIIGKKYREVMSVVYQIPFNVGHFTLAIFGYFIRDWRTLQFALSIPSIVLLSYYWLVPESPRWLFTVGRLDEASKILTKAAKMNKLPTEKIPAELEAASKLKGTTNAKGNAWDLVRTPNMRAKTFYMCFNWFICGLAFFGVAQYVGQTGGNIFANVAFSAALELPGTLFCIYSMKKWGRKKTLIGSNCMTGVCMLLIAVVPRSNPLIGVILASLGIVGMSISFPTVYLFAGELFPTVVRNIGIGSASTVARIGSMVAPFVAGLSSVAHWLPPVIFGVFPIIAAVLVVFLPETKGAPLPETMEDGENFGKKNKVDSIENGK